MSRVKNSDPDSDMFSSTFWIDFLLLPEKLDEHLVNLEAGRVVHPNPPELIAAFLDQVRLFFSRNVGAKIGNSGDTTKGHVNATSLRDLVNSTV